MKVEVWRDIKDAPGYQVSDQGSVRTLDRNVLGKDGRIELHPGKCLKPQLLKNGYLEVYVCVDGKRRHRTIHNLVAEAFLGERPKGYDVMHRNGVRTDNRAENLAYGTRSENLHSTYSYGGKQANGKLSLEDVRTIRHRLDTGESAYSVAKDYKVHPSTIYHVRDGKSFAWYEGGEPVARLSCSSIPQ